MRLPPAGRALRLTTGLILLSFAPRHLVNHGCGALRLDHTETIGQFLLCPWRMPIGLSLL